MSIRNEVDSSLKEDVMDEDVLYVEDDDDDDDEEAFDEFSEVDAEYDDDDDDEEDVESDYDDDDDDESEFLHMLIPPAMKAARRLFRGRRPRVSRVRTRRFNPYNTHIPRGGVRGGWVRTPSGRVPVRLPRSVVPMRTFKTHSARTTKQLNGLNSRLNRTQKDIKSVDRKAVSALAGSKRNRRAITRLSNSSQKQLRRYQKRNQDAIKKLKDDAKSQATTSMLMSMMQSGQNTNRFNVHTHPGFDQAPNNVDTQNSMSMFLPMMMMGDSDGDNNEMMMFAMMMAMNQNNQPNP